jgi:hypothetical protein
MRLSEGDIFHIVDSAKAERSNWETHWEEIAELVLPRHIGFQGEQTKGAKRNQKIFDSRPEIALERFGSVMDSLLTPRQTLWHNLQTTDRLLNKDPEVKAWFYEVNKVLFASRYAPKANFASQNYERWISTGAFGTGVLFIDYDSNTGLRYRTIHLKDLYMMENHQGVVDTIFRNFNFTARQAVQKWGEDKVPEKIKKAYENPTTRNKEFAFIHAVMPRDDYDETRADAKGMPWASLYLAVDDKVMMEESGYHSWPYSISRYVTAPGEVYGRSPAMLALADINMLQEMNKTDIRASHKAISPPILVNDDGVLGGGMKIDLRPDAVIPGGIDQNGRPTVQRLDMGARLDISDVKMEQRRKSIEDAFLMSLFQILVDTPRMTATEALIRAQEKGMLLTPTVGRQQSEALGPLIEREIDLLMRADKLPPLPQALIDAGGEYEVIYDSPMSRMQRAEELVGVQRTMELLAPFAQMDPSILDIFNPDELGRGTAEVSGVPSPMIRTPDQVKQVREARAQQQQQQQMIDAAKPVAGALKDAASANQLLTG